MVAVGVQMMHVLTPVYITYISIEVLSGALRGCGDVRVPTLITVFFVCGLRMLWLTRWSRSITRSPRSSSATP